jgi:hypothetical protein
MNRLKFLRMGSEKPKAVLHVLDKLKARTVVLMDSDTIWLRDPFVFLDEHPSADIFVTTDCLAHYPEVEDLLVPRCGHVRGGKGSGWALNTGAHPLRHSKPENSDLTPKARSKKCQSISISPLLISTYIALPLPPPS